MKSSRFQTLLVIFLMILLTLLIFHGVIFRPGVVYGKDTVAQGYPIAWAMNQAEKSGGSCQWFPYMMSGFPMSSSAPFYPLDWLLHVNAVTRAITWRYILHITAAVLLMFALLRRFRRSLASSMVGAIAFGFSAFFISKIYAGHGGAIWAGIWIPGVLLFLDLTIETKKVRYAVLTGAVIGVQALAQHAQYTYYSLLAMILFAAWRILPQIFSKKGIRTIPRYAGLAFVVALFAFLMSAPTTFSFLQQTALSNRGGGAGYDFASSLSLRPEQLITSVAPSFWGNPTADNSTFGALYWDGAMFIGVLPFIFALVAVFMVRDSRANYFKALALLSILIALGDHTPFFRLIYHIPGFSMARAPSKILYLYSFAAAGLAAYGIDLLLSSIEKMRMRRTDGDQAAVDQAMLSTRRISRLFSALFIGSATFLVVWIAAKETIISVAEHIIKQSYKNPTTAISKVGGLYSLQLQTIAWAVVCIALGVLISRALIQRKMNPRFAGGVILLVVFLDLWMYANPLLFTVNARKTYLEGDRKAVEIIKADSDLFRILPLDDEAFHYSQGVFDNIESVNGYYPISTARYATYVGAIHNQPKYVSVSADIKRPDSVLVGLLNVKYVISSAELDYPNLVEVHSGKSHVYYNKNWLPRAFTAHNMKAVGSADEAINEVKKSNFDPKQTVIIETEQSLPQTACGSEPDKVEYLSYRPDDFTIRADMKSDGYLVISEIYYPNWVVWIDGKESEIVPADYLFRGVYLTKGNHTLRMKYVDTPYRIGSVCASGAYAFIIGMLLVGMIRRKNTT